MCSLRRWWPTLLAIALAACSDARSSSSSSAPSGGTPDGGGTGGSDAALAACTGCHGDPASGNAAPPLSVKGATATSDVAVGAHQRHLRAGTFALPVACSECHLVPATVDAPGHIDKDRADLTWGPLATAGGVNPAAARSPDGTSLTCTVYCHGASMPGGSVAAPAWTRVDGSQAGCGTCHGIPPPTSSGHPAVAGTGTLACNGCHPLTVRADGSLDVAGGHHVNGVVDVGTGGGGGGGGGGGVGCTSCHGDPNRTPAAIAAAPPRDTAGNTGASSPGVGAHQAHLAGGSLRGPLACTECHVVPGDTAHASQPLDLTWGALARTGGTTPAWNGTALTCTNYCHGATLPGGSRTAPVWTQGASQAACGTCHGVPPPTSSGHPAVSGSGTATCNACHPGTVKADGTIDVAGGKHVNGTVDLGSTGGTGGGVGCTACHGDPNRTPAAIAPAPPRDVAGNTATSAPGVGAHQAHLVAGGLRGPVPCTECHVVPTDTAHASQPLALTWGALARADGVTPSWDGTALTCTNYCHGASLGGGALTAPAWTQGPSQAACGACHGLPPPRSSQHPALGQATCRTCHPATILTSGGIDVAGGHHVDGNVDVDYGSMTCTSCHGDATRTPVSGADPALAAAPPTGTRGETASSTRAVGAHQAHLNRGTFAAPLACTACHTVPTSTSHANGTVAVTWGTLARTGGASPSWDGASCSATYCHGGFTGGAAAAPSWTAGTVGCTSCHAIPPSTGRHGLHASGRASCQDCHGSGYSSSTVRTASHVNGVKDVGGTGSRINAWSASSRTCAPACHGSQTW